MTTTAQRYLTDEQIAGYHRDGYLAVPRLIDAERVAELRRVTDVFVVGLLLAAATADNGAMAVLPGSHQGLIYTHFDKQGHFVGGMRDDDIARLDRSRGVLLTLPAGSIHIHHYRLVHWSAPNTS